MTPTAKKGHRPNARSDRSFLYDMARSAIYRLSEAQDIAHAVEDWRFSGQTSSRADGALGKIIRSPA